VREVSGCVNQDDNKGRRVRVRTIIWRDWQPAILSGLDRYPVVGDRFEVNGELWRVVDARGSFICEREPS